jgi:ACR3 family arsenite transporter
VTIYIVVPLIAGYFTRRRALATMGMEGFTSRLVPRLRTVSIVALLATLVMLFAMQGSVIIEQPAVVGMIAVPIFINIVLVFGIAYGIAKLMRLPYEDAAPTAIIAGSNHFEVAIAVATTLFGLNSGAALATVVGVLTEVPFMLFLVWLLRRTRSFFYHEPSPVSADPK